MSHKRALPREEERKKEDKETKVEKEKKNKGINKGIKRTYFDSSGIKKILTSRL